MRNRILFLILAVSAGCAKELTLYEIETEAQNICNKRLMESMNYSFVECFKSEVEKLIEEQEEQSGYCKRKDSLRPELSDECGFIVEKPPLYCDPGMESCT
jgi:hypothetical protein